MNEKVKERKKGIHQNLVSLLWTEETWYPRIIGILFFYKLKQKFISTNIKTNFKIKKWL